MKVLVTGANGQLGKDLVQVFGTQFEVWGMGRSHLDVTSLEQTREVIHRIRPDVVVHAAAYTAVDQAESEEEEAYRVNASGTRHAVMAAEEVGAKFCYISTDYVFDGQSATPYREYDNTNPISVYGKSKRAGELFVQSLSSKPFVVRTSWVYGAHGQNFVKTMLRLASERTNVKVVQDQCGSPTYTIDLAKFLMALIQTESYGIYHASNSGFCTWYEFAKTIFEEAGKTIQVEPCTTEEFPRPAFRPKNSRMEHLTIRVNGFQDLREWRAALREFLRENVF